MTITPETIARVRALADRREAAPPGAWREGEGCVGGYVEYLAREPYPPCTGPEPDPGDDGYEPIVTGICDADRKFIVAASALTPDELRAVADALERISAPVKIRGGGVSVLPPEMPHVGTPWQKIEGPVQVRVPTGTLMSEVYDSVDDVPEIIIGPLAHRHLRDDCDIEPARQKGAEA